MKFIVREGFVIHDTRLVKQGDRQVEQTNSYYEGDQVDFDEATATAHLHKLEPADKEATKFVAARFVQVDTPPPMGGINQEQFAAAVASAVAQALAAAGVQAPAPQAPAA